MKTLRLIAFRGTGFLNPAYAHESGLIQAGHVGIQFEGNPVISGFHPTPEAVTAIGGEQAALEWLVERHILDGAIFDDTRIFHRAYELARNYQAPTVVYVTEHQLSDAEFDTIRVQLREWYATEAIFPYAWPGRKGTPMPADRDNCATFPRRLHIPIPEQSGRLFYYMDVMERMGRPWNPED